jgi:protoheme ferro-lyase
MSTRHAVLITYGEPPEPRFGDQLKYSWRILLGLTRTVAPIPAYVLPMIALSRARFRVKLWTDEHYRSPLEPITEAQARALSDALATVDPGTTWRVHVAWEFRDPLLPRVLDGIPGDEPVDIVPLYAADSAFTHALTRAAAEKWQRGHAARTAPVRVLPALDEEAFADASAAHVRRAVAARGFATGGECALVLAAHGTLLDPPRPYETGRLATERVAAAIARRLQPVFGPITMGWLNHVYGGRWTEPPADQALAQVAARGAKRVVYYPFGFLADNAESQLEGRIALRTQPALEAFHVDCLNEAPALAGLIAQQLVTAGEQAPRAAVGAAGR